MPIPKDHLIHKEYKQFLQDTEDYNTKVRELRSQLVKLVSSCNTSKQLYTAWPEAEKYAHCFPYKAPNRHAGATVSGAEMDIGVKISKASFKLPESNDG